MEGDVMASGGSGCGFFDLQRRVGRVLREAAVINETDRIQHRTAVFIQHDSVSDGFPDDLQPNSLRFEGSGIWSKIVALDRGIVHKVELDGLRSPLTNQSAVRLPEILLSICICSV